MAPPPVLPTHTRPALTSLPTELIAKIIETAPVESRLDIALVCRRLANCAEGLLHRHRVAYDKYRVASDRDPAAVLTLLRSVFGFGDPILAWHVRSFESWDLRRLKAYDSFPDPPFDGHYRYADGFVWTWLDGEVNAYLRVFEEAGLPVDLIDTLRREIHGQHDGALKAVLFATLPRLRDLKLARSTPLPGGMDSGHLLAPREPYACLGWLRTFIENGIHQSPQAPGLQGLESLAIGVKTGDEVGDQRSGHLASPKLLIQLLRLPRLLSLYLHRLSERDGDENCSNYSEWRYQDGGIYNPAARSSVLEHLYLDGIDSICREDYLHTLAAVPKALKTAALRSDRFGGVNNIGDHVTRFFEHQPNSIESIMLYNPRYFTGYRSRLYSWNEPVDNCPAHQFSLAVEDLFTQCDDKTRAGFVQSFEWTISSHIQVLVLHGDDTDHEITDCDDPLDEAIYELLRQPNEHDLKTIYLCGFEGGPNSSRTADGEPFEQVRFQKSITMGIKHGVDVVTRTTRRQDLINGEPLFPCAVDRYDLMTGRFGGQRPPLNEGRLFNPVTGVHSSKHCDHCGECAACFAVYPRELWEKTREERAWAMAREDWTESEYSDEEEGDADVEGGDAVVEDEAEQMKENDSDDDKQ